MTPGAIQEISLGSGIMNGPAYYARTTSPGPWLYIWPNGGSALTAYQFNGATLQHHACVAKLDNGSPVNSFSAALAVSANGSAPGTGLVWASMPLNADGYDGGVNTGVLRVFDASNLTTELWDSNISATRDGVGLWPKFRSPLVVNGKVYLGSVTDLTHGQTASLSIYGLPSQAGSASANSATFISRDLATQGNWPGVYGADGYSLAASVQSLPYYATLNVTTPTAAWTWAYPTFDPRGLMILPPTRIGGAWFSNSFVADVTVTGTHMVSVYAVDWDSQGRSETVQVLDGTTLAILDSETLSPFTNGVWLSWNVSGHIKIIVTDLTGPNAVLSGMFFEPAYGSSAVATIEVQSAGERGNGGGIGGDFLASNYRRNFLHNSEFYIGQRPVHASGSKHVDHIHGYHRSTWDDLLLPNRAGCGGAVDSGGELIRAHTAIENAVDVFRVHRARPAAAPEAQAHWKLWPPRWPVTSTTSPIKNSPGTFLLSIVLLDSSSVSTPPAVTSALS